jgi:hypothetical protein
MRHYKWVVLALLVILLIFGYMAFPAIHMQLGYAAGANAQLPNAASPAQMAAIQGAQQLLLLMPEQQRVYLPIATR